jgi:hypothetical protein
MEDKAKRGGCFSMCTRRRFGPVFVVSYSLHSLKFAQPMKV